MLLAGAWPWQVAGQCHAVQPGHPAAAAAAAAAAARDGCADSEW